MMERILRGIAGVVVLVSLGLAQVHSPKWLILTAIMGLNLLQSAFTNWCPMMSILRAMGIDKKSEK
ncbi:MAG: YgaP family membrane protein [Nitrospirota bacterium]